MTEITDSSGNVFADLGLDQADILLAKARIAAQISKHIDDSGLSQAQAAELLGIDQPKVSALVRGRLSGFTLDRLLRFLNDLNYDVHIQIMPSEGKGHTNVAA